MDGKRHLSRLEASTENPSDTEDQLPNISINTQSCPNRRRYPAVPGLRQSQEYPIRTRRRYDSNLDNKLPSSFYRDIENTSVAPEPQSCRNPQRLSTFSRIIRQPQEYPTIPTSRQENFNNELISSFNDNFESISRPRSPLLKTQSCRIPRRFSAPSPRVLRQSQECSFNPVNRRQYDTKFNNENDYDSTDTDYENVTTIPENNCKIKMKQYSTPRAAQTQLISQPQQCRISFPSSNANKSYTKCIRSQLPKDQNSKNSKNLSVESSVMCKRQLPEIEKAYGSQVYAIERFPDGGYSKTFLAKLSKDYSETNEEVYDKNESDYTDDENSDQLSNSNNGECDINKTKSSLLKTTKSLEAINKVIDVTLSGFKEIANNLSQKSSYKCNKDELPEDLGKRNEVLNVLVEDAQKNLINIRKNTAEILTNISQIVSDLSKSSKKSSEIQSLIKEIEKSTCNSAEILDDKEKSSEIQNRNEEKQNSDSGYNASIEDNTEEESK